jgi:hypothetical protein
MLHPPVIKKRSSVAYLPQILHTASYYRGGRGCYQIEAAALKMSPTLQRKVSVALFVAPTLISVSENEKF